MGEHLPLKVADRLLVGLYVAIIALLPFGRLAEVPVLLLSVWGLLVIVRQHSALWHMPHIRLFTLVFAAMMLITVVASLDSMWPEKS